MAEHLEAAKTAVLGLHLQKHMTDPASPVAQHTGFAEMVQKTNLFDKINRVLSAAREKGIFARRLPLPAAGRVLPVRCR
jgi:biuret amidohydrolase